jgi:hypothetical protein
VRCEMKENRVYDYNYYWECYSVSQYIEKHCSIPNAQGTCRKFVKHILSMIIIIIGNAKV